MFSFIGYHGKGLFICRWVPQFKIIESCKISCFELIFWSSSSWIFNKSIHIWCHFVARKLHYNMTTIFRTTLYVVHKTTFLTPIGVYLNRFIISVIVHIYEYDHRSMVNTITHFNYICPLMPLLPWRRHGRQYVQ